MGLQLKSLAEIQTSPSSVFRVLSDSEDVGESISDMESLLWKPF